MILAKVSSRRVAASRNLRLRFPGNRRKKRCCHARRPLCVALFAAKFSETSMLKFYFNGATNTNKVALFLEESGLPYELVPVDTRKGDQFKPEFRAVTQNGKMPTTA